MKPVEYVLNLDPKFTPYSEVQRVDLQFEKFVFSGGEVHIKLGYQVEIPGAEINKVLITHRINSSQHVMEVLLAADALRRKYGDDLVLEAYFPYIPYARQDRVMVEGEPLSLKVFANLINTCRFKKVTVLDPHSDVSAALINNLKTVAPLFLHTAVTYIKNHHNPEQFANFRLMVPDGGALKKSHALATFINYKHEVLCANKVRDVGTGKILRTEAPAFDYTGQVILIVDDILDGGRTFIELAKVLKALGAAAVYLAVSHAIVSHGETELARWLDKIFTTNSIKDETSSLIYKALL